MFRGLFAIPLLLLASGCPSATGTGTTQPGDPDLQSGRSYAVPPSTEGHVTEEPEKAAGGVIKDAHGKDFDIASTYGDTNALIVFYRGHW